MKLKNKIAVITGGNSGIGLGIAEEFKKEGASGVILGRNQQTLDEAQKKLRPNFATLQVDITKMNALDLAFQKTEERFGKIDVLVVNAGGAVGPGTMGPIDHVTEESFDKMVNLNFKGAYFTIQKALPYFNQNGSILLIASIAQHKGFANMSVYSACKAAVRNLARTLSAELLPSKGIRVNALSPGTIDTPVFGKLGIPDEEAAKAKESFVQLIPLKRIGTPQEMGAVAVFLASSDSSFVVGEEIVADGGVVNL